MLLTKERLERVKKQYAFSDLTTVQEVLIRELLDHIDTLKSDSIPKADAAEIVLQYSIDRPMRSEEFAINGVIEDIYAEINNYKEGSEG